jgi:hypothetical protein
MFVTWIFKKIRKFEAQNQRDKGFEKISVVE